MMHSFDTVDLDGLLLMWFYGTDFIFTQDITSVKEINFQLQYFTFALRELM